jgi:putative membrane protein
VASLPFLLPLFGPVFLAAVLVSALVAHCFLDAIPSTFLGIPDADSAVAVLPAHSLCLEGRGEEAVRIAALGSATGVILSIPLCLILLFIMRPLQPAVDWATGIVIVAVVTVLVLHSPSPRMALAVFLVSGLLGVFSFRYEYLSPSPFGESGILMPLLSGLFGISVLLFSGKGAVPPQAFTGMEIGTRRIVRGTLLGGIAGVVVGWLPGLSNATANGLLAKTVDS